jgi:hypothetical protein
MSDMKEILDVVYFGLELAKSIHESLADDGKITLTDIVKFGPVITAVVPAIVGIGDVMTELKNFKPEQLELIKDRVEAKLPDIGDKWITVAASALTIASETFKVIKAFQAK